MSIADKKNPNTCNKIGRPISCNLMVLGIDSERQPLQERIYVQTEKSPIMNSLTQFNFFLHNYNHHTVYRGLDPAHISFSDTFSIAFDTRDAYICLYNEELHLESNQVARI